MSTNAVNYLHKKGCKGDKNNKVSGCRGIIYTPAQMHAETTSDRQVDRRKLALQRPDY